MEAHGVHQTKLERYGDLLSWGSMNWLRQYNRPSLCWTPVRRDLSNSRCSMVSDRSWYVISLSDQLAMARGIYRLPLLYSELYEISYENLGILFYMICLTATASNNSDAPISFPEGAVSVVDFEELMEKDWSLLDSHKLSSHGVFNCNIDRIISAGKIDETSRVLVSISSEEFVDRLVDSSPCEFLLVVHDSLLMLAGIVEKYDLVKCWQGEIIYVPEKWAPFDVVFLYFLPALPFKLDEILGSLAKKCSPGGRVVISHPQGREILKKQRQEHPEVVVSDLPDKTTLQRVAVAHSYNVTEFVDEPGLYLAVLSRSAA